MEYLNSNCINISYSIRRYYVDTFYFKQISTLPTGSLVLDLGGHKIQKRGFFNIENYNMRVLYLDFNEKKHPDLIADAEFIPIVSDNFSGVICSEMLEHTYNPKHILKEIYRVLNFNGILLATIPFLYRIHADPSDYGRFTDQYWHRALQEVGYRDIFIERQGSFYSVFVDMCKQYINELCARPYRDGAQWFLTKLQRTALRKDEKNDVRENPFLSSYTTGYGVIAKK
jgi:ubiquinone/menaquinone biosynthesis C-methylase UbiE